MFFLLGFLAVLHTAFLPGFLANAYIIKERNIFRALMYSFALSLGINYFFTFLFVFFEGYNQQTLFILLLVEIILCIYYLWGKRKENICCSVENITIFKIMLFVCGLIFLVFYFRFLIGKIGYSYWWDALVSWNRWALDWFNGGYAQQTWLYPQLVPITSGMVYTVLGQEIHVFSIQTQGLYLFFIFCGLYSIATPRNFFAIMSLLFFSYVIQTKYIVNLGDADFPVMSMTVYSAIALYAWIQENNTIDFILAVLFACMATITKQAALVWLPFVFIIAYTSKKDAFYAVVKSNYLVWIVLSLFFPLSWYLTIWYKSVFYNYAVEIAVVTGDIVHKNRSYSERFLYALSIFPYSYISLFFATLLLFYKKYRYWALFSVIYFIQWSFFLSYDIRNAAIVMPFFALALGITLQVVLAFLYKKMPIWKNFSTCLLQPTVKLLLKLPKKCSIPIKYGYLILVICIIVLLGLTTVVEKDKIIAYDKENRLHSVNYEANLYLSSLLELNDVPMYTAYQPVIYLPGVNKEKIMIYNFEHSTEEGFNQIVSNPPRLYVMHNVAIAKIENFASFSKLQIMMTNGAYTVAKYDPENTIQVSRVHGYESVIKRLATLSPNTILSSVDSNDNFIYASGWSSQEDWGRWTDGKKASLIMKVSPDVETIKISLAHSFILPDRSLDLRILVNDIEVSSQVYTQHQPEISIQLPHEVVSNLQADNIINIDLLMPNVKSPKELGLWEDTRKLGIGLTAISTYGNLHLSLQELLPQDNIVAHDSDTHFLYAGGWSSQEDWGRWTDGEKASLTMKVSSKTKGIKLSFAHMFIPPNGELELAVKVNGIKVSSQSYIQPMRELDIKLPQEVVDNLENNNIINLEFLIPNAKSPKDLGLSEDARKLGVGLSHFTVY